MHPADREWFWEFPILLHFYTTRAIKCSISISQSAQRFGALLVIERFIQRLVDVPNFGGFDGRMLGVRRSEVWEVGQVLARVVSRNLGGITTVDVRSAQELCAVD